MTVTHSSFIRGPLYSSIMILYRYLLTQYLKVLLFCTGSLMAVLITTRFHQIAKIASSGAYGWEILQFTLYQIPYILPIVIPISCLLAAFLITSHLSKQNEITTLRASGLSFRSIFSPLLFGGVLMALINFYTISEVTSGAHMSIKLMSQEFQSIDPIALLKSKHLEQLKNFYVEAESSPLAQSVNNVQLAWWDHKNDQIRLLTSKSVSPTDEGALLKEVMLLSPLPDKKGFGLESAMKSSLSNKDLSLFLKQKSWVIKPEFLPLRWLLSKCSKCDLPVQKSRLYIELMRRSSLSLAAFTFTLLGIAFGIGHGRKPSKRGIVELTLLSTLFLICFFFAKSAGPNVPYAATLYGLPHLLIVFRSLQSISSISQGGML